MKAKEKKTPNQMLLERIQTARKKRAPPPAQTADKKINEQYRMLISAKLIERMISQNAYDEIMHGLYSIFSFGLIF